MTNIPTLLQLYNDIKADIQTEYGNTISPIGKVFLRAMAGVEAAVMRICYLLLAFVQKNIFVDTADSESRGGTLERFGRVKLGRNPFPAQPGEYKINVTGSIGATIPASTIFRSDDSSLNPGYLFILDNAYTLVSTSDTIIVRALTAGIESKLNVSDSLTATSPIALVDSVAIVVQITTPPLAAESIEDYRAKILYSYRVEAQGGASADYRLWSQDAQGVKQVYPYAKTGFASEIYLYVEATVADSIDGKGTPTAQLLIDVEDVVNFNPNGSLLPYEAGRRPTTVIVDYQPIQVQTVDIEISSFANLTVPLQTQLFNAIKSMIDKIRPYVDAADLVSEKNDILDPNKVINAILNQSPGASFGAITIKVNGVTIPNYTFLFGQIPSLNTVTYV